MVIDERCEDGEKGKKNKIRVQVDDGKSDENSQSDGMDGWIGWWMTGLPLIHHSE